MYGLPNSVGISVAEELCLELQVNCHRDTTYNVRKPRLFQDSSRRFSTNSLLGKNSAEANESAIGQQLNQLAYGKDEQCL